MSSITLTLTGNTSELTATFHPEIELNEKSDYSCGLLNFYTFHSVPNIHPGNNKLTYSYEGSGIDVIVPTGSYELDEIVDYFNKYFSAKKIAFEIRGNKNTQKVDILCDKKLIIDFGKENCISSVLGFKPQILQGSEHYISDTTVNITTLTAIQIKCDLTAGSFHNGKSTHILHEFSPDVEAGYKISENPRNIIYLPISKRRIDTVNIWVVDQDDKLLDLRGETITCRIHIRRDL